MAAKNVKVVYVQQPRREIRAFYGDGGGRVAEEFADAVLREWRTQPHLTEEGRLDVILSNIGPTVRAELRCQDEETRASAQLTLDCILRAFGEARSTRDLHLELLRTAQRPGETVQEYSHRVRDSFDALRSRQKTLGEQEAADGELQEQFLTGLADPVARRMLRAARHSTFLKLRAAAMELEDTGPPAAVFQQAVVPGPFAPVPAARQQQMDAATQQPAPAATVDEARLDRLEALVETMARSLLPPQPAADETNQQHQRIQGNSMSPA